jgi:hypothetical protein
MESLTSESQCPKGVAFIIHDAFHFVACILDLSDVEWKERVDGSLGWRAKDLKGKAYARLYILDSLYPENDGVVKKAESAAIGILASVTSPHLLSADEFRNRHSTCWMNISTLQIRVAQQSSGGNDCLIASTMHCLFFAQEWDLGLKLLQAYQESVIHSFSPFLFSSICYSNFRREFYLNLLKKILLKVAKKGNQEYLPITEFKTFFDDGQKEGGNLFLYDTETIVSHLEYASKFADCIQSGLSGVGMVDFIKKNKSNITINAFLNTSFPGIMQPLFKDSRDVIKQGWFLHQLSSLTFTFLVCWKVL